jgi:glycosyltransferase involved in cell wall biosynthesis
VAMEAAASGTPVIAFRRGALPEVVKDGVTGLLTQDAAHAVLALQTVSSIDQKACVQYAQENFSAAKMAERYSALYEQLTCAERAVRSA